MASETAEVNPQARALSNFDVRIANLRREMESSIERMQGLGISFDAEGLPPEPGSSSLSIQVSHASDEAQKCALDKRLWSACGTADTLHTRTGNNAFDANEPCTTAEQQICEHGLAGIGLYLLYNQFDLPTVAAILPGSPAEECGEVGRWDRIISIDGVEAWGLNMEQISPLMMGNPDTVVSLVLDGEQGTKVVTVQRKKLDTRRAIELQEDQMPEFAHERGSELYPVLLEHLSQWLRRQLQRHQISTAFSFWSHSVRTSRKYAKCLANAANKVDLFLMRRAMEALRENVLHSLADSTRLLFSSSHSRPSPMQMHRDRTLESPGKDTQKHPALPKMPSATLPGSSTIEDAMVNYECDYQCGFKGCFDDVEQHEKSCSLAPAKSEDKKQLSPKGMFKCAGDCDFKGTYDIVLEHEQTCSKIKPPQSVNNRNGGNMNWRCDYECGFKGCFDDVEQHEKSCSLAPAKSEDKKQLSPKGMFKCAGDCDFKGTYDIVLEHEQTCANAKVNQLLDVQGNGSNAPTVKLAQARAQELVADKEGDALATCDMNQQTPSVRVSEKSSFQNIQESSNMSGGCDLMSLPPTPPTIRRHIALKTDPPSMLSSPLRTSETVTARWASHNAPMFDTLKIPTQHLQAV